MNAEFQRIASRDKKAFLSDQCKETEENTRLLEQTEEIKKRWQEYTEELYKKDLNDLDNHDSIVSHSEPDILECEVKWALESVPAHKPSGGDRIQQSYLKS